MQLTPIKTRVFNEQEDLSAFIVSYVPQVAENTILAVASKLVCLWKGLAVSYQHVAQKEQLIQSESESCLKTSLAWLTIKNGMIMTNAGIDESNANGKLLLLPKDCYAAAEELRAQLKGFWNVSNLGIIITDSMILPLRAGVVGAAVGYAGFKGVQDLRGQADIFKKPLKTTLIDKADSLASAATLLMGEADEKTPLCLIENAPVEFCDKTNADELKYPAQDDLYAPLLKAVKLIN